jgi:hypothetical protein
MDYEIITVPAYDGTSHKQKALEVFDTVTGAVLTICRRAYMETEAAWVDRALARARNA